MKILSRIVPSIAVAALVIAAATAQAQTAEPMVNEAELDNSPSAGAMVFDLVVIRPLSLVGTVLGSAVFLLQMPLALIQNKPPIAAAKKLVVEPARYTFDRPLGQMD